MPAITGTLEERATNWRVFGLAQTGQLDRANQRTADSISIVEKCEKRDAETVQELTAKPWWRFW